MGAPRNQAGMLDFSTRPDPLEAAPVAREIAKKRAKPLQIAAWGNGADGATRRWGDAAITSFCPLPFSLWERGGG